MTEFGRIQQAYNSAQERYAELGVNTEKTLENLEKVSLSLHCWQGDDLTGFEKRELSSRGALFATGSHPGRARTVDELRLDLKKAYSLIPGRHRLNLHSMYGEFEGACDRNELSPEHFKGWIEWARKERLKIDFNSTLFSHPKADSGFTLSSLEKGVRKFWISHVKSCRKISAYLGRELKSPCIHNLWIPDGTKDLSVNRWRHRSLLRESLDEIFEEAYSPTQMKDSLESKLFGIGSESFVVGSHEFYLGYALARQKMVCLDLGHFHPTESIADKISAVLQFSAELLLHISRGVRWDSDHVVILNDDVRSVTEEIVRSRALGRVHLALDFFDASMNRIGAWVIGARAVLKALLLALLEPLERLQKAEMAGNQYERLALLEELKTMPSGAVWEHYCHKMDVPFGETLLKDVQKYEADVTSRRT